MDGSGCPFGLAGQLRAIKVFQERTSKSCCNPSRLPSPLKVISKGMSELRTGSSGPGEIAAGETGGCGVGVGPPGGAFWVESRSGQLVRRGTGTRAPTRTAAVILIGFLGVVVF